MAGTSKTKTTYNYVSLSSLKVSQKVDVYGVVKFLKQPYKSRGSDYCMMISIVDPSYSDGVRDEKLKCLLFGKEEDKLPGTAKLGDIVRFHRLAISSFHDCLQGQSSPGFSWLIFSGDPSDPLEPLKSSSATYSLTDVDKRKVAELRRWASDKEGFSEKLSTLNDLAAGCYFNMVCQVVCAAVAEADVCLILRVWDGTQSIYPIRRIDKYSPEHQVQKDVALMLKSRGFVNDVFVFDDHFRAAAHIKPGDFVKFVNLHAVEYKSPDNPVNPSGSPTLELVLHRGNSYGRGVKVVSPNNPELNSLKLKLEQVSGNVESLYDSDIIELDLDSDIVELDLSQSDSVEVVYEDLNITKCGKSSEKVNRKVQNLNRGIEKNKEPLPSTSRAVPNSKGSVRRYDDKPKKFSRQVLDRASQADLSAEENDLDDNKGNENCGGKALKISAKKKPRLVDEGDEDDDDIDCAQKVREGQDTGTAASLPRCMLQTTTVILSHPHIQRSQICDVLDHDVPYKFRVRAQVYDYHPKPESVRSFLKLYCSTCHYLCSLPDTDCNSNNSIGSQLQVGSTFKGVAHYNCPRCYEKKDSLPALDSPPHLQFIYMMRFLLRDDKGILMANIWRSDAETFFQSIEPEELLQTGELFSQIKDCLHQICPDNVGIETKPWIECCLKSYSGPDGTGFQMFDTTVV